MQYDGLFSAFSLFKGDFSGQMPRFVRENAQKSVFSPSRIARQEISVHISVLPLPSRIFPEKNSLLFWNKECIIEYKETSVWEF